MSKDAVQQENNPTIQYHHVLANQMMRDLGFEWNDTEQRWYLNSNFIVQGEATETVKKFLKSLEVTAR